MVSASNGELALCGSPLWRCLGCGCSVGRQSSPQKVCRNEDCDHQADIVEDGCRRPAGWGTDHLGAGPCKLHFGGAGHIARAAKRTLTERMAEAAVIKLGLRIETTPIEALEEMLYKSAGNVAVLELLVQDLDTPLTEERQKSMVVKLIKHPLVELYNEERDRHSQLAIQCAKLGLDERRTRVAEAQIDRLVKAVERALNVSGIDRDTQERFKKTLAAELRGA